MTSKPSHSSGVANAFVTLRNALRETNQSLRKQDLIKEFSLAKRKKRRAQIFFQLLSKNIRSRNITIFTSLAVVPRAAIITLDEIMFDDTTSRAEVKIRRVPKSLKMAGISAEMVEVMDIVINSTYRGKTVRNIVMENTVATLKGMLLVQFSVALIQTISELAFHNHKFVQDRKTLERVASSLNITGTAVMNMDQLRIAITDELVERAKK